MKQFLNDFLMASIFLSWMLLVPIAAGIAIVKGSWLLGAFAFVWLAGGLAWSTSYKNSKGCVFCGDKRRLYILFRHQWICQKCVYEIKKEVI